MPKKQNPKSRVSTKFVSVLAIISIFGFTEILLQNFFNVSIGEYSAFAWLMIMGIGFMLVSQPKNLYKTSKEAFNETSFSRLTTFVIGCMAIIAGILSFPLINMDHPILFATMGVISIISIIFIVFQTWIIREK